MAINPKITAAEAAEELGLTVQAIHKRISTMGLKQKKAQNRVYFNHSTSKKIINIKVLPTKIAFAVVKGGVGKTTLLEAFAIRSALLGLKVLCVDLDQQANLTTGLGMSEKAGKTPVLIDLIESQRKTPIDSQSCILNVTDGLDLLPSRLDNVTLDGYLMINQINLETIFEIVLGNIFKEYDLVLFDCPPTLGSIVSSAILASDLILCPLNPDAYSYEGIQIMNREFSNLANQFRRPIDWRIILNKFESRTILSSDYIKNILNHDTYSKKLLEESVIRNTQEFANCKSKGKSIYDTFKKTNAKEDINGLVEEVLKLITIENNNKTINQESTPEAITV